MNDTAIWVFFIVLYLWAMALTAYLVKRPKGDLGFTGAMGADGPPGPQGNVGPPGRPGKGCDELEKR